MSTFLITLVLVKGFLKLFADCCQQENRTKYYLFAFKLERETFLISCHLV